MQYREKQIEYTRDVWMSALLHGIYIYKCIAYSIRMSTDYMLYNEYRLHVIIMSTDYLLL